MPIDVNGIIQDQAQQSGVDPNLALAIILQGERSGQNAVSPKGAQGYAQLMPDTARAMGVVPGDPESNLRGGVKYMAQLQNELGTTDPSLIAAGYNAGPGAVKSHGGIPNYPETQAYVQRVKAAMPQSQFSDADFETDTKSGASQGTNSSAVAPKFADSDFEAAAPVQTSSGGSPQSPSLWDQAKRAAGIGARDVMGAGTQLLGLVGDPLNYLANKTGIPQKLTGAPLPAASSVGDIEADKLELPQPQGRAEQLESTMSRGLLQTLATFGLGSGAGAASGGKSALTALTANPAGQIGGALSGTAAAYGADQVGQKLGLSPNARLMLNLAAGLGGGVAGGGVGGRLANGMDAGTQATLDAAKSAGVPVQLSDVNPSWAAANRLTDKLPFGLGNLPSKNISAQQVAGVRSALADAAEQYRPSGLDVTSGAQGTDRFLANDLRQVAAQRQAQSNALYKNVDDTAAGLSLPAAETPAASAAAQKLWEQYPDALRNLEVDSKTRSWLNALKPGEQQQAGPQMVNVGGVSMNWDELNPTVQKSLQAAGMGPSAAPTTPPLTFQNLNDLRTSLGDVLGQAKQSAMSGVTSRTKVGQLSQLYKGLTDDINTYLDNAPPQLKQAAGAAQDYFKNQVLPLRSDPRINEVLSNVPEAGGVDTSAEGLHNYIFSTNKGETAQKYLGMLSPQGQQAAAYQSIKNATDAALNTATDAGLKSATGVGKLQNSPALDAISSANPGMQQDIARVQALMRLGRTAATAEAGKGALTGFQSRDLGSLFAMQKMAEQLEHHGFGGGAAYATAAGIPLAASNVVSALNSRLPIALRNYLLRQSGSGLSRALPGALGANAVNQGGQ